MFPLFILLHPRVNLSSHSSSFSLSFPGGGTINYDQINSDSLDICWRLDPAEGFCSLVSWNTERMLDSSSRQRWRFTVKISQIRANLIHTRSTVFMYVQFFYCRPVPFDLATHQLWLVVPFRSAAVWASDSAKSINFHSQAPLALHHQIAPEVGEQTGIWEETVNSDGYGTSHRWSSWLCSFLPLTSNLPNATLHPSLKSRVQSLSLTTED